METRHGPRTGFIFSILLVAIAAYGQLTTKNMGLGPEAARKCALQGDPDCEAKLASFYEEGRDGVPEDHAKAIMWYRKAANQGLVAAQLALATTYEGGYHVPKDYAEAAKWYRMAADRGDVQGQRSLAFFYWSGKGVPYDLIRAYMWANLAVASQQAKSQKYANDIQNGKIGTAKEKQEVIAIERKSSDAIVTSLIHVRDAIEREMTTAQVAEAQRLASSWKPVDTN